MLRLRPYKTSDAKTIISWCKDEVAFRKWTSDRYESFPITEADMNQKYVDCNGDCAEPDNFYPMTAFDESGIVGHLVMRYMDVETEDIICELFGEKWKVLELAITREEHYGTHRTSRINNTLPDT